MGLLHYCTFGLEAANDALNVRVDTARRNLIQPAEFIKNDIAPYII